MMAHALGAQVCKPASDNEIYRLKEEISLLAAGLQTSAPSADALTRGKNSPLWRATWPISSRSIAHFACQNGPPCAATFAHARRIAPLTPTHLSLWAWLAPTLSGSKCVCFPCAVRHAFLPVPGVCFRPFGCSYVTFRPLCVPLVVILSWFWRSNLRPDGGFYC